MSRSQPNSSGVEFAIRPGLAVDVAELQSIERAAGTIFSSIGMPEIAADAPPPESVYLAAIASEHLWVGVNGQELVGYGLMAIVDGHVHLEQASIHPRFSGHGFGRTLITHMAAIGRDRGLIPITLTTFADVPWNAPYYRTFGFEDLADSECGPQLQQILQAERDSDLGHWHRICMVMKT